MLDKWPIISDPSKAFYWKAVTYHSENKTQQHISLASKTIIWTLLFSHKNTSVLCQQM